MIVALGGDRGRDVLGRGAAGWRVDPEWTVGKAFGHFGVSSHESTNSSVSEFPGHGLNSFWTSTKTLRTRKFVQKGSKLRFKTIKKMLNKISALWSRNRWNLPNSEWSSLTSHWHLNGKRTPRRGTRMDGREGRGMEREWEGSYCTVRSLIRRMCRHWKALRLDCGQKTFYETKGICIISANN